MTALAMSSMGEAASVFAWWGTGGACPLPVRNPLPLWVLVVSAPGARADQTWPAWPPSTVMAAPFTYDAAGLQRNVMTDATSSDVP